MALNVSMRSSGREKTDFLEMGFFNFSHEDKKNKPIEDKNPNKISLRVIS
jgi:hypothetical protein